MIRLVFDKANGHYKLAKLTYKINHHNLGFLHHKHLGQLLAQGLVSQRVRGHREFFLVRAEA